MILNSAYYDERGQTHFAGEHVTDGQFFTNNYNWKPVSSETKKWSKPVSTPQRDSSLETSGYIN
jgi:hypothetical protein